MPNPNELLETLLNGMHRPGRVTHVESIPARPASRAWAGQSVVIATGTASGKSLGYLKRALGSGEDRQL